MANEERLIDAERQKRILQRFEEHLLEAGKTEGAEAVKTIIKGLKTEPAVDAVEVVHGRWEEKHDGKWFRLRCSACGGTALMVNTDACSVNIEWKYCPNCGASMRDGDGNA